MYHFWFSPQNSDLGKQYWSSLETYNVSVINSWTRGTKSITLPAGTYIIGQRSDVNCSNSIYLDTRIDTFKQDLPLYEKALNIPTTTARNDVTEYRSCNNTFAMGFSKETTLYFFCWADSPITIQYEIWAIKIKWNSEASSHLIASGSENSFCAAFQSRYQYYTNANYMLASGIYKTGKTGLNLPFEGYWIIITFNTSNDFGNSSTAWITQFAISTDSSDKAIYFRRNINYTPTTWESWNRLVAS